MRVETNQLVCPQKLFLLTCEGLPDLPYDIPLAQQGRLSVRSATGERFIRSRRYTWRGTRVTYHVNRDGESYTLVDLNRAGVAWWKL